MEDDTAADRLNRAIEDFVRVLNMLEEDDVLREEATVQLWHLHQQTLALRAAETDLRRNIADLIMLVRADYLHAEEPIN